MFRAECAAGTRARASACKAMLDNGDLVPDELTIEVVRARLGKDDTANGLRPRRLPADARRRPRRSTGCSPSSTAGELAVVLDFELPDEVAVQRLLGRAAVEGRSDDLPDKIKHRLDVYHEKTEPLIEYYRSRGLLVPIDAGRSVEEVFARCSRCSEAAARAMIIRKSEAEIETMSRAGAVVAKTLALLGEPGQARA